MKKNIVLIMSVIIFIMVMASLSIVFAAPYDLIHKTNPSKNYSFIEFMDSPTVFDEVLTDVENYLMEAENGKFYSVVEVDAETSEGKSFNEAIVGLEPVKLPGDVFEVIKIK